MANRFESVSANNGSEKALDEEITEAEKKLSKQDQRKNKRIEKLAAAGADIDKNEVAPAKSKLGDISSSLEKASEGIENIEIKQNPFRGKQMENLAKSLPQYENQRAKESAEADIKRAEESEEKIAERLGYKPREITEKNKNKEIEDAQKGVSYWENDLKEAKTDQEKFIANKNLERYKQALEIAIEKEKTGLPQEAILKTIAEKNETASFIEEAGKDGRKALLENILLSAIEKFKLPKETGFKTLKELIDSKKIDLNQLRESIKERIGTEQPDESHPDHPAEHQNEGNESAKKESEEQEKERKAKEEAIAGLNLNAGKKEGDKEPTEPKPDETKPAEPAEPKPNESELTEPKPAETEPTETNEDGKTGDAQPKPAEPKRAREGETHRGTEPAKGGEIAPEYELEYIFSDDKKPFFELMEEEFEKTGTDRTIGRPRDIVEFYLKTKDKRIAKIREKLRTDGRLKPGLTDEQIIRLFRKNLDMNGIKLKNGRKTFGTWLEEMMFKENNLVPKYRANGEKTFGTRVREFFFRKHYPNARPKIPELDHLEETNRAETRADLKDIASSAFNNLKGVNINALFQKLVNKVGEDEGLNARNIDKAAEVADLTRAK